MPIIPFVDEGQRLVPGSPVPIGGEKEARLPGEAAANLGQAMFNLGDALDLAARKIKDAKDKSDELKAFTAFRKEQRKAYNDHIVAEILPGDESGNVQVDQYNERMAPLLDELAGHITNEESRERFKARAEDLMADTSSSLSAHELVKREKRLEVDRGIILNNIRDTAMNDPGNYETYLKEVDQVFDRDDNIQPALREVMRVSAKKEITKGVVDEQLVKGSFATNEVDRRRYFNSAKAILMNNSSKLFNSDERDEQLKELQTKIYHFYTGEAAKQNHNDKIAGKRMQEQESEKRGIYLEGLFAAGNSDFKRRAIELDMMQDVLSGNLDANWTKEALSTPVFKNVRDDYYEIEIMTDVLKTGKIDSAIQRVNRDSTFSSTQTVSADKGALILSRLQRMRDDANNNPDRMKLMSAGKEFIKDWAHPSVLEGLGTVVKSQRTALANRAALAYVKDVLDNPKIDPKSHAEKIYRDWFLQAAPTKGEADSTIMMQGMTPEGIEQRKTKLIQDAKAAAASGKPYDEKAVKKLDQTLERLEGEKQLLLLRQQGGLTTPSTQQKPAAPSAAGARGSRGKK